MRIGILGSGLMGAKLGTILARTGHQVTFSYSRKRSTLDALAKGAGKNANAGTPDRAAATAAAVILAVHWSRLPDVLDQAGDLSGKVVISCSLPMNEDDTELILGRTTSGAEELARMLPESRVVSVFNTVPSEVLFGVFSARKRKPRPALVYCGDDRKGKRVAATLIKDVGFDPVDLGPLRMARFTEPFALLVAQIAYEGEGKPDVAYQFRHYPSRSGGKTR